MQMLRMSSTDPFPGDEQSEAAVRARELHREMRELEGMSPEDSTDQGEVKLQIGAGHELDDLNAIEPLAGEGRCCPRARRAGFRRAYPCKSCGGLTNHASQKRNQRRSACNPATSHPILRIEENETCLEAAYVALRS